MTTLVWFHAHPDDEAILTGGSMLRAAEGHRNVLVIATNGDHGEVPDDLRAGESLADRRRAETEASAARLGVARLAWLGYADSGMTGWPQNDNADAFFRADPDEAAGRLAALLTEERADVLVTYDWHGGYGHPDHIKVHQVGHRAAELAGTARVFEATINRDAMRSMAEAARAGQAEWGEDADAFDVDGPADDGNPMGVPASELTHEVDVTGFALGKRQALRCHASQITDTSFFATMDDDAFVVAFGTEWYIQTSGGNGLRPGDGPQHRWLLEQP